MNAVCKKLFVLVVFVFMPRLLFAQATITGTVKDTSGAVLPGVTVEASSPVLIEKVRSAVTDSSGLYRIVDLRPGTYSVTVTLPGFATVKRDGIEVIGSATLTIPVEMKVGELQETVTVTGASPVVDVQNTRRETQWGVNLQQELMPRVSLEVGSNRRWWSHFNVTDNLAVAPSDYEKWVINAPKDSRLPGGGGYPIPRSRAWPPHPRNAGSPVPWGTRSQGPIRGGCRCPKV